MIDGPDEMNPETGDASGSSGDEPSSQGTQDLPLASLGLPVLNVGSVGMPTLGGPGTRKRLFDELGGRENVAKVVDRFYDRIEDDPELRRIFPANMVVGRARQKLFLEEWLGGEAPYTSEIGPWRLRVRHAPFRITEDGAFRWVGHMEGALLDCGASAELATEIASFLRPVAFRMVNASDAD